jgi:iron complex transport system permease protein
MTFLHLPTASSDLVDDLNRAARRRSSLVWVAGLAAVLFVTLPAGVGLGPVAISPSTGTKIFGHHLFGWPSAVGWSTAQDAIVWQVGAPRVVLGAVVGAGLAVTGVALQALVRNVAGTGS